MKQGIGLLDRYIGSAVVGGVAVVLALLLGLFTLFELISELEGLGQGDYGVGAALVFVMLRTPRLCYELFPAAALIGTSLSLSLLSRSGELTVMRCAGVSRQAVVFSVMKAGLVFVVFSMCLGEFVSPHAEQYARAYRSVKRTAHISLRTPSGMWARDGNSYVNIRQVLPGNEIRSIFIHEFDPDNQLRTSTYASSGVYEDGRWILENITQTQFADDGVTQNTMSRAAWDSILNPDVINVVTIDRNHLSVWALYKYIDYLNSNGQSAEQYEYALWAKVMYPIATGVMVFLAIPMVFGGIARTAGTGQRVLIGTVFGLVFHLVNEAMGHLGVVSALPPFLSASGTTMVVLLIAVLLLRRTT